MIERLSRRTAYENNWMRIHEDEVRFPNGHEGIFGVVDKADFAVVIPINAEGEICLVEQYRYPIAARTWELPMGSSDQSDAATEVAKIELREETGLIAEHIDEIGQLLQAPGYAQQGCSVFVATGLTQSSSDLEHTESDLIAQWFAPQRLREMIRTSALQDATTIAALGLAALHGHFDFT